MKRTLTAGASLLIAAPFAAVITLSSAGAAFACAPGYIQFTAANGAPICVVDNSSGVGGGGHVSSGGDGQGTPSSGYVPPVQAAPVAPVAPPAYVPPAYVPPAAPAAPQPAARVPAPAPVYAPPVSNQVQPNTYAQVVPEAPNTQISTNETIKDAVADTTAVSEAANDEVKDTSVSEPTVSADASSPSPSASNEAKKVTKIDKDNVSSSESEEAKSLSAFAILWIFIGGGVIAAIGGAIYQVRKMNRAAKDETAIEKESIDS